MEFIGFGDNIVSGSNTMSKEENDRFEIFGGDPQLPDKLPDDYFESLGGRPRAPPNLVANYRFHRVLDLLSSGNVLDVGVYFGTFLSKARADGREIFGTEINQKRAEYANNRLNESVVNVDFQNGKLNNYSENQVNNVTALEVIEHTPNDKEAISELCRVARKRVVITVPFEENRRTELCVHCQQWTPRNGHFNSYTFGSFEQLSPDGWTVDTEMTIATKPVLILSQRIPDIVPKTFAATMFDKIDQFWPGDGKYFLVTLKPIVDTY